MVRLRSWVRRASGGSRMRQERKKTQATEARRDGRDGIGLPPGRRPTGAARHVKAPGPSWRGRVHDTIGGAVPAAVDDPRGPDLGETAGVGHRFSPSASRTTPRCGGDFGLLSSNSGWSTRSRPRALPAFRCNWCGGEPGRARPFNLTPSPVNSRRDAGQPALVLRAGGERLEGGQADLSWPPVPGTWPLSPRRRMPASAMA